jgi:hypothetical protein
MEKKEQAKTAKVEIQELRERVEKLEEYIKEKIESRLSKAPIHRYISNIETK